ncbi:hypothetical protein HN51_058668, partial [Arachis hypogaea]
NSNQTNNSSGVNEGGSDSHMQLSGSLQSTTETMQTAPIAVAGRAAVMIAATTAELRQQWFSTVVTTQRHSVV